MSHIAKAASVLLARGSSDLFIVRRAETLRFFGGFLAFPGGKVAPSDGKISLTAQPEASETPFSADRYVAAAREVFEETGVLLARQAIYDSFELSLKDMLDREIDNQLRRFRTADAREGIHAFLEKRRASFSGE